MIIAGDKLHILCPKLTKERAYSLADLLTKICPLYNINSFDIFHEFIANVAHESDGFTRYEESLNYSTQALLTMFGRHRISELQAQQYGRNNKHKADQLKIANTLYGGVWGKKNLGNTQPDDGWMLRGSGPIQITGRSNITAFCKWMNSRYGFNYTVEQMAELIRTDDYFAIHSACWVFAVAKNLVQAAVDDKIELIAKRINGGIIGMNDRLLKYEKAKELFA